MSKLNLAVAGIAVSFVFSANAEANVPKDTRIIQKMGEIDPITYACSNPGKPFEYEGAIYGSPDGRSALVASAGVKNMSIEGIFMLEGTLYPCPNP